MLRGFCPFFACLCAQAMLLLAASPVYAQVISPESDIEWRNSPKPQIKKTERIHIPVPSPTTDGSSQQTLPIWSVETTDVTLSNTLLRWSREEKWQLLWEADRDFPILANVYLKGSFQSAILTVMQSLSDTDYPMQAIMNPNTRIIRIVRYLQTPNG